MEIRTALRVAIGVVVIAWMGLLDGCLSARQALERELDRAEQSLDSGVRGASGGTEGDPTFEARAAVATLEPVLARRGSTWIYGKGYLEMLRGYNFVPWWLASSEHRQRYAALTDRVQQLDALYHPDAHASATVIAAANAWLAANPERERLEKIPAARRWILYADTTGALHPLHMRLREDVVGQTANSDTWFAIPVAHHWTRVRRQSSETNEMDSLLRSRCYDAIDLLVGRTAPFEALGVVRLATPAEKMVSEFTRADTDITALLRGFSSSGFAADFDRIRAGIPRETPITEAIADPVHCTTVPAPMEATFASWLVF